MDFKHIKNKQHQNMELVVSINPLSNLHISRISYFDYQACLQCRGVWVFKPTKWDRQPRIHRPITDSPPPNPIHNHIATLTTITLPKPINPNQNTKCLPSPPHHYHHQSSAIFIFQTLTTTSIVYSHEYKEVESFS